MQSSGGAAILMQTDFDPEILNRVRFLVGKPEDISALPVMNARKPFDDEITEFLNAVSKELMSDNRSRQYSDVVTFAFWIRKASLNQLKERFVGNDGQVRMGRGVVFHIAPSNVPVNFAYSLVTGLLNGNANIVRVPSKDFMQVNIISEALQHALAEFTNLRNFVFLVRYERDKEINDLFSSLADVRVVWGGDATIAELRKSPLPPRSTEITFADRYSLAVIDSDAYMALEDKKAAARDFYNDTFFSDQNACTSPRIVVWTGTCIEEAKRLFWKEEHLLVKEKYGFQAIQAVNKQTSLYLAAEAFPGCRVEEHEDNLILRIKVPEAKASLMDYRENSGFFFEYDAHDIMEIRDLCDDKRCQTIGYIGDKEMFVPLIQSGIRGVDRIVPIGKTMDFALIWDGYDLVQEMTRIVMME